VKPPVKTGSGARALSTRLKKPAGRTTAQHRWLTRQLNDPYVKAAKEGGYRSRAAFKLLEIDAGHRLLKPGDRVLDLGAAPGGWSQVAAAKVGAPRRGRVVAVDILPMAEVPGVEILQLDFLAEDAPERLKALLGGPADVVLSDMAANATGHRQTDHIRTMMLVEAAAEFAMEVLAPGGRFLAKVIQGGTEAALLAALKRRFAKVVHVKPPASRSDSAELYVLATGFRPAPAP
jgi:23S rRNA (uridine2552-2'-O)-methyltransferase